MASIPSSCMRKKLCFHSFMARPPHSVMFHTPLQHLYNLAAIQASRAAAVGIKVSRLVQQIVDHLRTAAMT